MAEEWSDLDHARQPLETAMDVASAVRGKPLTAPVGRVHVLRTIPRLPMLRKQYYDALKAKPAWPMQPYRVDAIYGTMKRTISQASDTEKDRLKQLLLNI